MAAPSYDVEILIENIKRRCSVPTSQLTYTPLDFTLLANDELQGEVVPLMMSTREEYFVDYVDVETDNSGVVPIPEVTVASKVRSVCYVQQTSPLVLNNLPRVDLDVVAGVGYASMNTLSGFYIQNNDLILYPNRVIPSSTPIRIYFYRRTLVLASPSTYGRVVAIDEMSNTLQLNFLPYDWDTGTQLNAISSRPGFEATNPLMTVVSVSSPSVIVDTIEGISVGDYISEFGYSAIPQVPIEAHAYLAQLTAAKCLEGLGDRGGMEAALAKAETLKKYILVMMSQRVDGSTKKVISPSGGLRLNAGIGRWGMGSSGGWF